MPFSRSGNVIEEVRLLTARIDKKDSHTLESYRADGGYETAKRALRMEPDEVTGIVKASGLRGRGGAGFPCGLKWTFLPKVREKTYLCVNADESEPGTFKDRVLLEYDPHLLIEGIIISCHALRSDHAFIYIRGEFCRPFTRIRDAVKEAYDAGILGADAMGPGRRLDVTIHRGGGAYICGEETALLNSIEGKKGQPRIKPPFPTNCGLFSQSTVINNVETLANVPIILRIGADEYRKHGTEKSTGTRLIGVSGHVNKPGVYELEHGVRLIDVIEDVCGGMRNGNALKAVIPGGSSVPVLTADEAKDLVLCFDECMAAGTMLGSAGVIVMDETTCMVWALDKLTHFYAHESCGPCTPCREGSGWIAELVSKIESGSGTPADLDKLVNLAGQIVGNTICVFSDAVSMPVTSFTTKFRSEFEAHVNGGSCLAKTKPQAIRS